MEEKECMAWIGETMLECKLKDFLQSLGYLVSYLDGNIVCTIGRDDGGWNKLFQLGRTGHNTGLRYLFYSSRWINVLEISFAHAWTKRSLCRMQCNVSKTIFGVLRGICDYEYADAGAAFDAARLLAMSSASGISSSCSS